MGKKRNLKFHLGFWGIILCLAAAPVFVAADSDIAATQTLPPGAPTAFQEVKETVDEVVRIAQIHAGNENTTIRRQKLREVIAPRFDFDEMSKRSLGSNWNEVTPEQQKEFVDVFSNLLARTYLERVETVKPGMVKVDGEEVNFPKALVRSTVTNRGDSFPIDYKTFFDGKDWKVYDVVIENIGLVANYRNEFAGIIRKEKFAGLMERLRSKAAK